MTAVANEKGQPVIGWKLKPFVHLLRPAVKRERAWLLDYRYWKIQVKIGGNAGRIKVCLIRGVCQ